MDVPDWSNDFGASSKWKTNTYSGMRRHSWWGSDVQTYSANQDFLEGIRFKGPHQVSPKYPDGWRDPNNYRRVIQRFEPLDGEVVFNYTNSENPALNGQWQSRYTNWVTEDPSYHSEMQRYGEMWAGGLLNSNAARAAITKCLNSFIDGGANVSEDLAEAHKTVSAISGLAQDLAHIWHGFRTRDVPEIIQGLTGTGRDIPKALSKRWLEYQYGWKPLIGDIKSLWDQFSDIEPQGMMLHGVGRASDSGDSSAGGFTGNWEGHVKCTIWATIDSQWTHIAAKNGLINPGQLAWELLPWSFIVDWAVPVGQLLSAYTATAGLSFRGGSIGSTLTSSGEFKDLNMARFAEYEAGHSSGFPGYKWKAKEFRRNALGGFPEPVLYFKNPLSTTHIANAGALILSMLK